MRTWQCSAREVHEQVFSMLTPDQQTKAKALQDQRAARVRSVGRVAAEEVAEHAAAGRAEAVAGEQG